MATQPVLSRDPATRVLLADDHQILRQGVRMLLEDEPDFIVVGEAGDGDQAVKLCGELKPDVVVLDISMPGLGGLQALSRIRAGDPDIKILILTMHDREEYVFETLNAGASGYVLKDVAGDELIRAIRSVAKGRSVLSPDFSPDVFSQMPHRRRGDGELLTRREREVLRLASEGKTNRQIAKELVVSVKTVQTHRSHVMAKLGIHDRVDLVKYALRHGLCDL